MNTRNYLLATTAPMAALGYASLAIVVDPDLLQDADSFDRRSPDSAHMFKYWDKIDAIMDGLEGMLLKSHDFLPEFRDEDPLDYAFRKQCTKMTNVYSDIVGGLSSKPFEQAVQLIRDVKDENGTVTNIIIPDEIEKFQWDVDGSGNNITVFAAHTFHQGINNAIDWIMVDHDKHDPDIRSVADMKARGMRPYWSHILARNVLDVQSKMIDGKEVISYIKILEPGEPDHIREFVRTDIVTNGRRDTSVMWRLWRKKDTVGTTGKREYVRVDSGDVSIKEIPLVPFVTGRREGRRWRFDPPMRAAAELQINLFKQESGLEHASTLTAYPMLAANGISPPTGADGKPNLKLAVGPSRVLWSKQNNDGSYGSWAYVEPGSESLKFLQSRIVDTIQQLREVGRQPLTASSSNITVITAAVAAGKARSAVKAWAYSLKDALENALLMTAKWMGVDYNPTVHVFAEFDDWMEGEDLEALDKARERGDISHETYCEELQRRGVLSSNFTIGRERKRLLNDLPGDGPDTEVDD